MALLPLSPAVIVLQPPVSDLCLSCSRNWYVSNSWPRKLKSEWWARISSFLGILTNYIWARLNCSIRFISFSHSLRNLQLCKGFLTDFFFYIFFFPEWVGLLNPRYREWDGRSFIEIFSGVFFRISPYWNITPKRMDFYLWTSVASQSCPSSISVTL